MLEQERPVPLYLGTLTRDGIEDCKQITSDEESKVSPKFSPDSKNILYASDLQGDEKFNLYFYDSGKATVERLTKATKFSIYPNASLFQGREEDRLHFKPAEAVRSLHFRLGNEAFFKDQLSRVRRQIRNHFSRRGMDSILQPRKGAGDGNLCRLAGKPVQRYDQTAGGRVPDRRG